jgi:hypothetical protein
MFAVAAASGDTEVAGRLVGGSRPMREKVDPDRALVEYIFAADEAGRTVFSRRHLHCPSLTR